MRNTMRRFGLTILSGSLLATLAPAAGCGGGSGPTGSSGNLCGRISVSNQGVSVQSAAGCTGSTGGFTNTQRDQFGRVTSLQFDFQCTAGGNERLVGSVFNVTYNNLGEVLSYQATINGQGCSFP